MRKPLILLFLVFAGYLCAQNPVYEFSYDAAGNRISKELLCKSVYKARNEVIQFGR